MEKFRSQSLRYGEVMEKQVYYDKGEIVVRGEAPCSMEDLRSYSTSYAWSAPETKKMNGTWMGLKDPELQRKKRVASYKVYTVEGKMKGSFKRSFRWIKETYTQAVHGWR